MGGWPGFQVGRTGQAAAGGAPASNERTEELDPARFFVEDRVKITMKPKNLLLSCLVMALGAAIASRVHAQSAQTTPPKAAPPRVESAMRLTIQVSGGEKETPVENASVYVKYVEGHLIKDKKFELNVKTNHEGTAHIPDAPMGKVLVQVVAEGWKTYGRWFEVTDPKQTLKVHLEKPAKWY
jgi:hypothetical protein